MYLEQISYETFCRFGAIRNRLLSQRWCNRCKRMHYYSQEGQLVYPSVPHVSPGQRPA